MRSGSKDKIICVPVETRQQFRYFVSVPRRLYRDMPGYLPPLDFERRQLLDQRKAAFFDHGHACYWIAYRNGICVGRISAQIDQLALDTWKSPIGCFGCLDAIDDRLVVQTLLQTAATWLSVHGMERMRGPFNLSINGESGLQVDGQENGGMIMVPWHPNYLSRQMAELGVAPAKDLVSYTLDLTSFTPSDGVMRLLDPVGIGANLKVRSLDFSRFEAEAEAVLQLFNDAWSDNWGFVPFTQEEVSGILREMKPLFNGDEFIFVENDGRVVAFALILPNLAELGEGLGGRITPLGAIKLALRLWRKKFRSARLILFGVRRDQRGTLMGALLPTVIFAEMMKRQKKHQHETIEFGWVLEDNLPMRRFIERSGAPITKRHRLYELDVASPFAASREFVDREQVNGGSPRPLDPQ